MHPSERGSSTHTATHQSQLTGSGLQNPGQTVMGHSLAFWCSLEGRRERWGSSVPPAAGRVLPGLHRAGQEERDRPFAAHRHPLPPSPLCPKHVVIKFTRIFAHYTDTVYSHNRGVIPNLHSSCPG